MEKIEIQLNVLRFPNRCVQPIWAQLVLYRWDNLRKFWDTYSSFDPFFILFPQRFSRALREDQGYELDPSECRLSDSHRPILKNTPRR